uniref:Adenosine 5'-monophosphoramidase HINT3 n=1 Tax=Phallusia mammillata TaxID=59560 RepID=A0A6F9DEG5_9ASCI|nr:histidine triad nucleotide-binding protein 3-like [Phallusia mammillata]
MGNLWSSTPRECVFCKVLQSLESDENSKDTKILKYNETFAIFSDIKPAAEHHYLVVPRNHISNPKTLQGKEHANFVQEMYDFALSYVTELGLEKQEVRFGFRMPPFISVEHLHLHIISPFSNMSFVNSNLFKENSWYFLSPETLIKKLQTS